MTLTAAEKNQIAAIWHDDDRDARLALKVTINRSGQIEMWADTDLLTIYAPIIVGNLLSRISGIEQGRRRREARMST